ncbi:transposable element Tcb1 transposase [Trichonephila clavipes]|nr:transposable element Tcb1 transposase [Trichonephila clavipes]
MRIVFPQDGGIYQQDIAECHTTDRVRAWFKEHQDQFIVLPCPENSPDLSPINNLWNFLDRKISLLQVQLKDRYLRLEAAQKAVSGTLLQLEDNGEEFETDFTDAESYIEKYLEYYTHIDKKLEETVFLKFQTHQESSSKRNSN